MQPRGGSGSTAEGGFGRVSQLKEGFTAEGRVGLNASELSRRAARRTPFSQERATATHVERSMLGGHVQRLTLSRLPCLIPASNDVIGNGRRRQHTAPSSALESYRLQLLVPMLPTAPSPALSPPLPAPSLWPAGAGRPRAPPHQEDRPTLCNAMSRGCHGSSEEACCGVAGAGWSTVAVSAPP